MDWLKSFSENYANAVTALAAVLTFVLAFFTLLFLKREYSAKYRPYVTPVVAAESVEVEPGLHAVFTSIRPINVGPCKVKISAIQLQIGDETFDTPSQANWILVGSSSAGMTFPCGQINPLGLQRIREGRYRQNRIEARFSLHTASVDDSHRETQHFVFEIEVRGEQPVALFRPEWVTRD